VDENPYKAPQERGTPGRWQDNTALLYVTVTTAMVVLYLLPYFVLWLLGYLDLTDLD
jgi:hypothetical protein